MAAHIGNKASESAFRNPLMKIKISKTVTIPMEDTRPAKAGIAVIIGKVPKSVSVSLTPKGKYISARSIWREMVDDCHAALGTLFYLGSIDEGWSAQPRIVPGWLRFFQRK